MISIDTDPQFRAAQARYEQITAQYEASVARIDEEAHEQQAEDDAAAAEAEREREAARAAREAAAAEPPPDPNAKPDNPWAQPTRRPDSATRIGSFDDEAAAPPAAESAPPAPAPTPAPVAPPPPPAPAPAAAEPEPVRGRHSRLDDDDDFEAGSFLRG